MAVPLYLRLADSQTGKQITRILKSATTPEVWYTIYTTKEINMTINLNSKATILSIYFVSFLISTLIVKTFGMIGLIPYVALIIFFPLKSKPNNLNVISATSGKLLESNTRTKKAETKLLTGRSL